MNTDANLLDTSDAEVGRRITEAILIKGKSAKAIAVDLKVSYSTMRRTLAGERSFTIHQLERISNHLGMKPSALVPASFTDAV